MYNARHFVNAEVKSALRILLAHQRKLLKLFRVLATQGKSHNFGLQRINAVRPQPSQQFDPHLHDWPFRLFYCRLEAPFVRILVSVQAAIIHVV